jgi:indole-3-glycerol phosphate synthase
MSAFIQALQVAQAPLIAEIKPFSPECGDLLRGRAPLAIARSYVAQGAPCLSVTTGRWHHGSLAMLKEIADGTGVPILRKDFITRRAQLAESQAAGASAVLFSAQLLRQQELLGLASQALALGLTPFIEADAVSQLEGLDLPDGCVLAMCNRDIRQQEKDQGSVDHSLGLYQSARACGPALLVSASAMRQPPEAVKALQAGFDSVLIGTALLLHESVEQGVAAFIHALSHAKKDFI